MRTMTGGHVVRRVGETEQRPVTPTNIVPIDVLSALEQDLCEDVQGSQSTNHMATMLDSPAQEVQRDGRHHASAEGWCWSKGHQTPHCSPFKTGFWQMFRSVMWLSRSGNAEVFFINGP